MSIQGVCFRKFLYIFEKNNKSVEEIVFYRIESFIIKIGLEILTITSDKLYFFYKINKQLK